MVQGSRQADGHITSEQRTEHPIIREIATPVLALVRNDPFGQVGCDGLRPIQRFECRPRTEQEWYRRGLRAFVS